MALDDEQQLRGGYEQLVYEMEKKRQETVEEMIGNLKEQLV